jgi:hypothetical protein
MASDVTGVSRDLSAEARENCARRLADFQCLIRRGSQLRGCRQYVGGATPQNSAGLWHLKTRDEGLEARVGADREAGRRKRLTRRPRTRRCLLKGCEQRFRPRQVRQRYCSDRCREAARDWSLWKAQETLPPIPLAFSNGKTNQNVDPCPGALCTRSSPPIPPAGHRER